MNMNEPIKHRRKLNTEQIEVLELLYKFRFGSNDLFARYFGMKDRSFVFKRLSILQERGLIGKRFEPSYRLQGKPAAYYLLPEGARTLQKYRDQDDADEVNVKGIYKDARVSEAFIKHCFNVFHLYNQLTDQYDDIDFLSKSDQVSLIDELPKPLPDAYITLDTDPTEHFFVDVLDDDAHLLVDASKKMRRYIKYRGDGDWAALSESPFPKLIFVCNSEKACKQVQKRCDYLIDKSWETDITVQVITIDTITLSYYL
jgi:hypothetical protein